MINAGTTRWLLGLLLAGLLGSASLQANNSNEELYDAVAPEGSAFVRVLNLTDTAVEFGISSKHQAQLVSAGNLGGYRFVAPGNHSLQVADQQLDMALAPNKAVTLVYHQGQIDVFHDELVNEPRKVQLVFYNLSDQQVALKTLDGAHEVVAPLATGQVGNRSINEVRLGFAAFAGQQQLAVFEEVLLQKGRSYSYFLLPDRAGYRALVVANSIDALD